jgi:hypothetical protein
MAPCRKEIGSRGKCTDRGGQSGKTEIFTKVSTTEIKGKALVLSNTKMEANIPAIGRTTKSKAKGK